MLKIKEWFNRYKYAEIAGIIVFLLVSYITHYLNVNAVTSVLILTYSEFLVYYFIMYYVEQKTNDRNKSVIKAMISLLKEFGPAEIIDLLFSRNFLLYICPIVIGNYAAGLIVGKILADVVFYFFTIISFERLKRRTTYVQLNTV